MTEEITNPNEAKSNEINYEILYQNLLESQTQRYIIDNSILFSPPQFSNIPEDFKILYKSLNYYNSFEINQHFYENVLQALEYVTKKNLGNVDYSVYWINILSLFINVYQKEDSKISEIFKVTPKTMIQDQFQELMNILEKDDYELLFYFSQQFSSLADKDEFLESITTIFQMKSEADLINLFQKSIEQEVNECYEASTLFRSNATASKLMKFYSQNISLSYIKRVAGEIVEEIIKTPEKFQLDEKKLKNGQNIETNIKNITELVEKFIKNFEESIPFVPHTWRRYCKFLFDSIGKKFTSVNENDIFEPKHYAIGGFIILRVLNPAIVSPQSFGLTDEKPSTESRKFLIDFSRILQNFSNGMLDTHKDKHLIPFKDKGEKWILKLKEIFIELSMESKEYINVTYDPTDNLDSSFWMIYKVLVKNLEEVKEETKNKENLSIGKKLEHLSTILSDIKQKKYPPDFMPLFISKKENNSSKEQAIQQFSLKCYNLLTLSYSSLIEQVFEKITKILEYTLFNIDYDNPVITPFKRINPFEFKTRTDFGLSLLDSLKENFEKNALNKQIQNHFFESLIIKLDAYISNIFFKIPEHAKRAVEIKVGMAHFENWYQTEKIKVNDENGQSIIFKHTREIINVCIVAQVELVTDQVFRQTICPNLTINQIEILLKNLIVSFKKVIKDDDLNDAYIKKSIHLHRRTCLETGKIIKSPVFDLLISDETMKEIKEIKIPQRFQINELNFLK
eukprot:gene5296-8914_t